RVTSREGVADAHRALQCLPEAWGLVVLHANDAGHRRRGSLAVRRVVGITAANDNVVALAAHSALEPEPRLGLDLIGSLGLDLDDLIPVDADRAGVSGLQRELAVLKTFDFAVQAIAGIND